MEYLFGPIQPAPGVPPLFEGERSCHRVSFYRTLNGAEVGDLFMRLIDTCQLNGANSFQYLTELQRHAPQFLAANPSDWMPWNYRENAGANRWRLMTPA